MALPAAILALIARPYTQGGKMIGSQLRDRITSPGMKTVSNLNKKGSSQLRDRMPGGGGGGDILNLLKQNPGATAAFTTIGGLTQYGIYKLIRDWIDSGDLDENFEEADLDRLMMEADYDAEDLDEVKGELYEGPDEDEKFLSSYIRGGQTGLRNEQGDLMTRQESKDEYSRLHGSK
jgi:hypothetical protein